MAQANAPGPLRVHPENPRYTTPDGKRAILLTGSHTWDTMSDMGPSYPPEPFDFDRYLDFLARYGHNFIRLWAWDSTWWDTRANQKLGKDFVHVVSPHPWQRTGPGEALDGLPKFDLDAFNPDYFKRLRDRVSAAGHRGMYVSVMLFEGWGLMHGNRRKGTEDGWAWRGHPFNAANNINGIDGGKEGEPLEGTVHSLADSAVNAKQSAYIRKVVETVNDLDNVLYEVINEGGDPEWDWWVVEQIRACEKTMPKQHLVGITGHGAENLASMLASPADWISPGAKDGYGVEPPAWMEDRPSLLDTDHIWGAGGTAPWVWKSVTRGHNPLFMDRYDGSVLGAPGETQWEGIRKAMGQARRLTERMDLAAARPHDALASTGWCLANPGTEYLVYKPEDTGSVRVELEAGTYSAEWFDPMTDVTTDGGEAVGGKEQEFQAPVQGEAVLYLLRMQR